MACNYTIKLQDGTELTLGTNFETQNNSIGSFKNTLDMTNVKELKDILKKIEDSSKKSVSIDTFEKMIDADNFHLGTVNVVGTTSIFDLTDPMGEDKSNSELDNSLISSIKTLANRLSDQGTNIRNNNVIASTFSDSDPKNLVSRFYKGKELGQEGFLILDINDLQKGKYLNLLKGLTDYAIHNLGKEYDLTSIFKDLNLPDKQSIQDYFNTLPNTFDNSPKQLNAIKTLESAFNLSTDALKKLYFFHNFVPQASINREGKINRTETILNEANRIYYKYAPLVEKKDWYYSNKLVSANFPALSPGDLIKYNPTYNEGSQKYTNPNEMGYYYMYIDSIQKSIANGYYETQYVIKDLKTGELKYVPENKLKFPNENLSFVYQKNEQSEQYPFTEQELNTSTPFSQILNVTDANINNPAIAKNLKANDLVIANIRENYILSNLDNYVNPDSIKKLVNGDLIFKKSGDANLIYTVIKVFANSVYVKNKSGKLETIPNTNITGVAFSKVNHTDLVNVQLHGLISTTANDAGFYSTDKGFVSNKITPENKISVLKGVNIGDILFSKTIVGTFHNLILGFNNDRSEFSILTKKGTQKISANDIINVVYNLSDNLGKIQEAKTFKPILNEDIKNIDSAKYNSTFNVFNVLEHSDYSNNLKLQIKNDDFVVYNNETHLVLNTYSDRLKIYDLNKSVKFVPLDSISHIIKNDATISLFEYNTVMLNSFRYDTLEKLTPIVQSNDQLSLIKMKYVKYSEKHSNYDKSISPKVTIINDNTGQIKDAHWISEDKYLANSDKYVDVTTKYAEHKLGSSVDIYAVNRSKTLTTLDTLKDQSYHINIKNLKDIKSEWLFNNITNGMFVQLGKGSSELQDWKIYRVESVSKSGNQGLFLSYSKVNENTGKLTSNIKFVPRSEMETAIGNVNLNKLMIPSNFGTLAKFLPELNPVEYKTLSTKKIVTEKDKINVISNIAGYIDTTFGVKTKLISNSSPELAEYKTKLGLTNLDDVKAFILNGVIHINTDTASITEPLHEMMHLIFGSIKTINPELYLSIVHNISDHPNFDTLNDKYNNLTYLDRNEEVAIQLLSEDVEKNLVSYKAFNTNEFNNTVKDSINKLFNLKKDIGDFYYQDLLKETPLDLINNFGSDLFTDTKNYFSSQVALDSIRVMSVKRDMMEKNKLTEECIW